METVTFDFNGSRLTVNTFVSGGKRWYYALPLVTALDYSRSIVATCNVSPQNRSRFSHHVEFRDSMDVVRATATLITIEGIYEIMMHTRSSMCAAFYNFVRDTLRPRFGETAPLPPAIYVRQQEFAFDDELLVTAVFVDTEDQRWLLAKPLADVCGYSSCFNAVERHVDEHNYIACSTLTKGRVLLPFTSNLDMTHLRPNSLFVNIAGVYQLINRSRMPNASRLREWIETTVLPYFACTVIDGGAPGERRRVRETKRLRRRMAAAKQKTLVAKLKRERLARRLAERRLSMSRQKRRHDREYMSMLLRFKELEGNGRFRRERAKKTHAAAIAREANARLAALKPHIAADVTETPLKQTYLAVFRVEPPNRVPHLRVVRGQRARLDTLRGAIERLKRSLGSVDGCRDQRPGACSWLKHAEMIYCRAVANPVKTWNRFRRQRFDLCKRFRFDRTRTHLYPPAASEVTPDACNVESTNETRPSTSKGTELTSTSSATAAAIERRNAWRDLANLLLPALDEAIEETEKLAAPVNSDDELGHGDDDDHGQSPSPPVT